MPGPRFSGNLEANMGPKTGQNGVRKGSEKKANFEDDFGRRRGGPGPPRTPRNTPPKRRKAAQAHPGFLLSAKLWSLRGFNTPCTLHSAVGGEY